jgi:hypothetical protein
MIGIGNDRREIPERMLTSYFKVKVVAVHHQSYVA